MLTSTSKEIVKAGGIIASQRKGLDHLEIPEITDEKGLRDFYQRLGLSKPLINILLENDRRLLAGLPPIRLLFSFVESEHDRLMVETYCGGRYIKTHFARLFFLYTAGINYDSVCYPNANVVVHHRDGDCTNDSIENLGLMYNASHSKAHNHMRKHEIMKLPHVPLERLNYNQFGTDWTSTERGIIFNDTYTTLDFDKEVVPLLNRAEMKSVHSDKSSANVSTATKKQKKEIS